jgi:O-acetyl-ADP-ribose deacetylase (regulator of RNase III)
MKITDRIEVIKGDITQIHTDAIVNAANPSLMGGSGVDGAIHRAGGSAIIEDCKTILARQGQCKTGEAVITTGGNLPSRYVIHTVGPVWRNGEQNEAELLSSCYQNSLVIAANHLLQTIAFPNISTGAYGFPKELAANIATKTIYNFLNGDRGTVEQVLLICFDDENFEFSKQALELLKTKE